MKKKLLFFIFLSILVGGGLVTLNYMEIKKNEISLAYEYGSPVSMEDIVADRFKDNYKFDSKDEQLTKHLKGKAKKPLPVGTYSLKVYNSEKQNYFKIVVDDTKEPVFTKFSDIVSLAIEDKKVDWNQFFCGDDASKVTLKVDDSEVEYGKEGSYPIQVSLQDAHGNSRNKDSIVEISSTPHIIKNAEATYIKDILIVNKLHSIPADFASGENAEASEQIKKLITDMQNMGYDVSSNYSGFRTHKEQIDLYNQYVQNHGQEEADKFSARPGYSEHETGLSFDLKDKDDNLLEAKKEADWISKNAHKYGFIVRYPEGKEAITGYISEPWHLRYVGVKTATDIYLSGLCLEEYLDVPGGINYKDQ